MATRGILMAPISWALTASLLAAVVLFLLLMDGVKIRVFRYFGIR